MAKPKALFITNKNFERDLREECTEILRRLMARYAALQPDNKQFDVWDHADAASIVADLIEALKYSDTIEEAHHKFDWGK